MCLKESGKKFIAFASHLLCFGLACDLLIIFFMAYLNEFRVVVYVNSFGEAHFELFLFPLTLVFCLLGLWYAWHYLKKYWREHDELER